MILTDQGETVVQFHRSLMYQPSQFQIPQLSQDINHFAIFHMQASIAPVRGIHPANSL
jgi:hypothetical protein